MKWILTIFVAVSSLFAANTDKEEINFTRTITGIVQDDEGSPLPGATVRLDGTPIGAVTGLDGSFSLSIPESITTPSLTISYVGYAAEKVVLTKANTYSITLNADQNVLDEVVVSALGIERSKKTLSYGAVGTVSGFAVRPSYAPHDQIPQNTEDYSAIEENGFKRVSDQALTTFSVDVDRASYSNVRRFINQGSMPPVDAVRIEEMINYFNYSYDYNNDKHPIDVHSYVMDSPWNKNLKLVHIGLQAETISTENLPASNLVFLLDVSGSMSAANKLGLVKSSMELLVNQLREQDKVSIVVYAGSSGVVLEPTSGANKETILGALDRLNAGGSTAGGAGIKLAYKLAQEHFIEGGNNRVILATDGDFNVGESSDAAMQRLIEEKRKGGVYLSVLGFGMGNYKDNKMETLADKGNGNYAYIDNIKEARKVFVSEFGGTLFTVAKDVKLQVEFNPAQVKAYRLIGYENRALANEDFKDDKKDAGDMGSGHSVTAIYEIVPAGVHSSYLKDVDELKYQNIVSTGNSKELMTVKIRYKEPDKNKSKQLIHTVKNRNGSKSNQAEFAVAVAEFGLLLRDSDYKGSANYNDIISRAQKASGDDAEGSRAEFVQLVKSVQLLDKNNDEAKK